MNPSILSIGRGIPKHSLTQDEIALKLSSLLALSDSERETLMTIFQNAKIEKRYAVFPEIMALQESSPKMSFRNQIFKKEAPELGKKAALDALKEWPLSASDITHVISVSCTGAITPGIDFYLVEKLGLSPYVSLSGLNFLGCHGAFKALKMAASIAKASSKNRILIVCTELCSLHCRLNNDLESIVIQSLFGDGAAAAIVGCDPKDGEKSLFEIKGEASIAIPNSLDKMSWEAGDAGFDMTLSRKVPGLIGKEVLPFVTRLLGEKSSFQDHEFAIHPGGKEILEMVEKRLSLDKSQTESSWRILKDFGNMSSATFLYLLADIKERNLSNKNIVGLGFGPGLTIEGLLLSTPGAPT